MSSSVDNCEEFTEHKTLKRNCCKICGKHFAKPCLLKRHEAVHSIHKAFKCDVCHKMFSQKSSLQRHRSHNHEGLKKYSCKDCNRRFSQRVNRDTHMQRTHVLKSTTKKPIYPCNSCSCAFSRLNILKRHITAQHSKINCSDSLHQENDVSNDQELIAKDVMLQLRQLQNSMGVAVHPKSNSDIVSYESPTEKKSTAVTTVHDDGTNKVNSVNLHFVNLLDKLNPNKKENYILVRIVKDGKRLGYVCDFCNKIYKKSFNFIRHHRLHTRLRPYNCTYCQKSFKTQNELNLHKTRHALNDKTGEIQNQYTCSICNIIYDSMRQLDIHIRDHTQTHSLHYICLTCRRTFTKLTDFSSHRHSTSTDPEMVSNLNDLSVTSNYLDSEITKYNICGICGLRLHKKFDLKKHEARHLKIGYAKCNICGRSFVSKSSLYAHNRMHQNYRSYVCSQCNNKNFITKSQLQRHMLHCHENIGCFKCTCCEKTFKSKSNYLNHLRRKQKSDEFANNGDRRNDTNTLRKGQIVIQDRINAQAIPKFIELQILPKYQKHKHQNFTIETLKKSANTSSALQSFGKNSTSQNRCNICEFCSKSFRKPSDLQRHLRTHTNDRPFNCNECQKNFALKSTLEEHKLTHLAYRDKFKCQVCAKEYASKKTLNLHLRLHTGNLPFKCDVCGKGFRTSGHYTAHLKTLTTRGHCNLNGPIDIIKSIE